MRQHPGFFTITEAAAATGTSEASIRRRIASGVLKAIGVAAATKEDPRILLSAASVESLPEYQAPDACEAPTEEQDRPPCAVAPIGANLEELAAIGAAHRRQAEACLVEGARLKRLCDDRAERIFAMQRDVDRLENAIHMYEEARSSWREQELVSVIGGVAIGMACAGALWLALL